MWYEALPSLLLTGVFVFLPYSLVPVINKFTNNGNPCNRMQRDNHERYLVRRDGRLGGGSPYNIKLLESIPD